MGAPALAYGDAALSAFELDFYDAGERRREPLGRAWGTRFEAGDPTRTFNWAKDTEGFAGWYYSVTAGGHVGYESRLERDRLILMDRDPEIIGIASQPFWLHWREGKRLRRHAPDYFVRLADGRARVVDVRAGDRMDKATAELFAGTQVACRAVGWEFSHVGVPDPVAMANVRWLSRAIAGAGAAAAPISPSGCWTSSRSRLRNWQRQLEAVTACWCCPCCST
ncbi:TnsA-like heteromeric transposase endonuclease subunit [Streptomyces sp. DSM 118878]